MIIGAEYRREANRIANNGKERKDLYTGDRDVHVLVVTASKIEEHHD